MFANHPQAAIDYGAMRSDEFARAATLHQRAAEARRGQRRRIRTRRSNEVIARIQALRQFGFAAFRRARSPIPREEAAPVVS